MSSQSEREQNAINWFRVAVSYSAVTRVGTQSATLLANRRSLAWRPYWGLCRRLFWQILKVNAGGRGEGGGFPLIPYMKSCCFFFYRYSTMTFSCSSISSLKSVVNNPTISILTVTGCTKFNLCKVCKICQNTNLFAWWRQTTMWRPTCRENEKRFDSVYLTIIPWARVGYEMVNSQRGAQRRVGYNQSHIQQAWME